MHKLMTNNKTSNCPKKKVKYVLVLLNLFSPTCQNHHLSYYPRKSIQYIISVYHSAKNCVVLRCPYITL